MLDKAFSDVISIFPQFVLNSCTKTKIEALNENNVDQ